MIEGKMTGSRRNMEWTRKELLRNPKIRVLRISEVYPAKGKEGRYCLNAKYVRIPDFKRTKKKGK